MTQGLKYQKRSGCAFHSPHRRCMEECGPLCIDAWLQRSGENIHLCWQTLVGLGLGVAVRLLKLLMSVFDLAATMGRIVNNALPPCLCTKSGRLLSTFESLSIFCQLELTSSPRALLCAIDITRGIQTKRHRKPGILTLIRSGGEPEEAPVIETCLIGCSGGIKNVDNDSKQSWGRYMAKGLAEKVGLKHLAIMPLINMPWWCSTGSYEHNHKAMWYMVHRLVPEQGYNVCKECSYGPCHNTMECQCIFFCPATELCSLHHLRSCGVTLPPYNQSYLGVPIFICTSISAHIISTWQVRASPEALSFNVDINCFAFNAQGS